MVDTVEISTEDTGSDKPAVNETQSAQSKPEGLPEKFNTVGDLAKSLIKLFNSKSKIKNIGIRHGEKLHETLLTSEEFSKSEEFDNYFKVPFDSRDLNYSIKSEKENEIKLDNDYNSLKTKQLSVDEIISKLLELSYIQNEIS